VLDRLGAGDSFAELAAEYSIDPGSGQQGGVLPCSSTGTFANTYIPEFVDAALAADVGDPVGPVASQFGFHVILVRPFDDLGDELDAVLAEPALRFDLVVTDLDGFVDPRYGTFDGARGVVPLGLPTG
jgi:parvulin-like peptidyl-prolyl isomerase